MRARILVTAAIPISICNTGRGCGEPVRKAWPDEDASKRTVQDPATIAWNLCTTTYFKAAGPPWRLKDIRPAVCYVGIVFKKDSTDPDSGNACCGAQLFLRSGDGLVFRGAVGPGTRSN